MLNINLAGNWQLTFFREGDVLITHPDQLSNHHGETIPAVVPGNLELDLQRAGKIDDPYLHLNAKALRPYEFYEWWLQRDFTVADASRPMELVFEGLDCYGAVWLNGHELGQTANAMIRHTFDVTGKLVAGTNHLTVRIGSANVAASRYPIDVASFSAYPYNYESLRVRKPAHEWGWDITPRMALGGIWRPVYLQEIPLARFTENYLQTLPDSTAEKAELLFFYNFTVADRNLLDCRIKVTGVCGDSSFTSEQAVWSPGGAFRLTVPHPKLWWPRGYGEPHLYQVKVELYRGKKLLAEEERTLGIRTLELKVNPTATIGPRPDFAFIINGETIMAKGTNWVPADALHSRDAERIPRIVAMAEDLNCNMFRLWGGGVYEDPQFYDLCDRKGIMIWHDFMMGCAAYPQDEDFQQALRQEVDAVVKALRQHPAIVLWAGDNECDLVPQWAGNPSNPGLNPLTRKVIPEELRRHDPARPYLPSSPWISEQAFAAARADRNPDAMSYSGEQHLWGPRDYFKSDFYRNTNASFVSEIGYHGCPGVSSIEKFISPAHRWPYQDNPEWNYHASNPWVDDHSGLNYRTDLMANQIREMFGAIPDHLEDFVVASQICQAEAKKYFIELVRGRKGKMTGVLWWNLIDCWPQFSDAIVDYYFNRKLAYYFIKRIQQPVAAMLTEPKAWKQQIILVNDSLKSVAGRLKIWDADSGETVWEQDFAIPANGRINPAALDADAGRQKMLLLSWTLDDGTRGVNHYLCGTPAFELEQYRRQWLPQIAALDASFRHEQVGK